MHLLIESVDELARQWNCQLMTSERQRGLVCATLSRAKSAVLELEKLIAYILTKETSAGTAVDRSAWISSLSRIKHAKDNIRRAREDLNTVWATTSHRYCASIDRLSTLELTCKHSRTTGRIELELRDITASVVHIRSDLSNAQTMFNDASEAMSREMSQLRLAQGDMISRLKRVTHQESSQNIVNSTANPRSETICRMFSSRGDESGSTSLACRLVKRRRCSVNCTCICHQHKSFWSPNFLCRTLGLLFIGYKGSARIFMKCDTEACRASSVQKLHMSYLFPRWLATRMICINVCPQGPELLLRCLRMRPYATTPIFQSISRCQLDNVQSLMGAGQASVLDVDEFGRSLLQVSLSYMTCADRLHDQKD